MAVRFNRADRRGENAELPSVFEIEVDPGVGVQVTVSRTNVPDPNNPDVNIQEGPQVIRIWLTDAEANDLGDRIKTEIDAKDPRTRSR